MRVSGVLAGVAAVAVLSTALASEPARTTTDPPRTGTQFWAAEHGDLRVTVELPDPVYMSELFDMKVHVTDDRGIVQHGGPIVMWGDEPPEMRFGVTGELTCGVAEAPGERPREGAADETYHERHTYRADDWYRFSVSVTTGGCVTEIERVDIAAQVLVSKHKVLRSNGPQKPKPMFSHEYFLNGDPSILVIEASADDPDGFVDHIELEWGDGSKNLLVRRDRSECTESPKRYPQGSIHTRAKHRYAKKGTYTLRLIATSKGCNGRENQFGFAQRVVNYPPAQGT